MERFFRPATQLMGRLSYPQKFALVGLMLLTPLIVVMTQFLAKINEDIAFSAKERVGLVYNAPLIELLRHVQHHAFLSTGLLNGEDSLREAVLAEQGDVQAAIDALDALDARLGSTLQTTEQWTEIKTNWAAVRSSMAASSAGQNMALHNTLMNELLRLITIVGNNSNLILDPEIDSYYLMDTVITKIPLKALYLSQLSNYAISVVIDRRIDPEDRAQLSLWSGLIQSTWSANRKGIGFAYQKNPALQLRLNRPVQRNNERISAFLSLIDREFITRGAASSLANTINIGLVRIEPESFIEAVMTTVDESYTLYAASAAELDALLANRIAGFEARRAVALLVTLLALAAALYLFVGFYLAVQKTIRSLDQASQRMIKGSSAAFQVEARDELAQVALAFSNIATELMLARDRALEASRAKSSFLANMSHELRTPLNAIIGYSELIEEEMAEEGHDQFIPDLKKIQTAATHLLALINDILDLSKIEAGRMELFLEDVEVPQMIRDVVSTITPMVEKNGNRLDVSAPADLPPMYTDLTKARQILFNLLSNASKFTEKGLIRLEVKRQGEQIVFTVTDTGIGMTPQQLQRLFADFSQADSSTTRKYGGTGLGLSISRRFAQMLGGDIAVTSQPGDGSTFTVTLPLKMARPAAEMLPKEQSAAPDQPEVRLGPLPADASTVLVIDDDASVRELVSRFLTREGFSVRTAVSGAEGLRAAREFKPDVITLDVMMPGMDGWAVLTALKADPELSSIPVVMMTIVSDKNLAYALGAADYLTKPIDRDRLIQALRKYECKHPVCKILVVDDDPQIREIIQRTLAKEGYAVSEAVDGQDALEKLNADPPEIILLDLMMPRMDGFDFLLELRRSGRSIPVIVVTARDLSEEDRRRLNGQVMQILQKGAYRPEELLAEVRLLAGKVAAQRLEKA